MKKNCTENRNLLALPPGRHWVRSGMYLPLFFGLGALLLGSCNNDKNNKTQDEPFPTIQVPDGFRLEKVVDGLNFPTSLAWDAQGKLYVAEAGGGFLPEPQPARLLRVESGKLTEVVNLTAKGVVAPVVGLTFFNGSFYISHRSADLMGAVSRVSADGSSVNQILGGFETSQAEHPLNDVRMGPDGRMYLATGPAFNSAVPADDVAPFVSRSPNLRTTAAQDLVLLGKNFKVSDFRTKTNLTDSVLTGAYVPFGVATTVGQRIAGTRKPGGAIVSFDPTNAEATLQTFASGMRNVIGLAWDATGQMYTAVNGFDVRGARPVKDEYDATYKVVKGTWYGFPDYSAALEPLTLAKFNPPANLQAPIFVGNAAQGRKLSFVIDHAASGLTAPDRALVAGLHPFHSSPSMIDVAPASWGAFAGQLFVAEWGDLTPPTDPTDLRPVGYRVVRINPATKQLEPFLANRQPGPASKQGNVGSGLERPFDVQFGPDGAMYIVDYGVVKINEARKANDREPYEYVPGTGVIWKVSKR